MYKNYQNVKGNQWHNPDISAEIKRLNITEILNRAGLQITRNNTCLCPFHEEKTPSFRVYPETASFYCWGCGKGGDSITFIREYYGVNFPEALKIAGIDGDSGQYHVDSDYQKKQALLDKFERWKAEYSAALGQLVFDGYKDLKQIRTHSQRNAMSRLFQKMPVWEYHLSIIQSGDESLMLALYADLEGANG